jgi:hypothetical protein
VSKYSYPETSRNYRVPVRELIVGDWVLGFALGFVFGWVRFWDLINIEVEGSPIDNILWTCSGILFVDASYIRCWAGSSVSIIAGEDSMPDTATHALGHFAITRTIKSSGWRFDCDHC